MEQTYRIAYCDKCGKEEKLNLDNYGENCECGNAFKSAWKVIGRDFSCVKFIQAFNTN